MPTEAFNGPPCSDLVEFMKSVKDIPAKHKGAFDNMSKKAIETICDIDALHVWESGDDLDELLQLTQVIMKLKIEASKQEGRRRKEAAMVIISSEQAASKDDRDAFERICELVHYLTEIDGKKHLHDTVCAFDAIVVVRGIDYTPTADTEKAINRIDTALERVFKMQRPPTRTLIWHHGPTLSLLLSWIDGTTSALRTALAAISITAALDLANGVKPSPLGKANTPADLKKLEEYAKRLGAPVMFVDPASQLITFEYLATYMYYWAYYIHAFLPPSVLRAHFFAALDENVTYAFRLRGASEGVYGLEVVRMVQEHLSASTAQRWAKTCIDPSSYTKAACRAAGTDAAIHHAVQLADAPFALFTHRAEYALPAFSRLPLCPAENPGEATGSLYFTAPVRFNPRTSAFRATSSPPFYILLPLPNQTAQTLTGHVQGTMLGVLQAVRSTKGLTDPKDVRIDKAEVRMWEEVRKACVWAIDGCRGKMPEGVEGKVAYVRGKLERGTWGSVSGVGTGGGGVKKTPVTGRMWQGGLAGGGGGGGVQGAVGQGQESKQGWQSGQAEGWGVEQGERGGWSSGAATVGGMW